MIDQVISNAARKKQTCFSNKTKTNLLRIRQQELQDEFFELEKKIASLTIADENLAKSKVDNSFNRCGAVYEDKKKREMVCCRKIKKQKGYVKFCGYHRKNDYVSHILDEKSSTSNEHKFWMEELTR